MVLVGDYIIYKGIMDSTTPTEKNKSKTQI